jgi:pseudouridine kinase
MTTRVLGIGATLIDELYFTTTALVPHSSNPAQKSTHIGGVMHNIMHHLALLGVKPGLITAIGNDAEGQTIKAHFDQIQIDYAGMLQADASTGKYVSILDEVGNLFVAVCEDNCGKYLTVAYLESQLTYMMDFDLLLIDTNLETEVIQWLIHFANANQKLLIIEPVSVTKARKLAALDLTGVYLITPNEEELEALGRDVEASQEEQIAALLRRGVSNLWLRQGAQGSTWITNTSRFSLGVPTITIADTTGAGDAALAGWVFGFIQRENPTSCLQLGQSLALHILQQKGAVDPKLDAATLHHLMKKYYHEY